MPKFRPSRIALLIDGEVVSPPAWLFSRGVWLSAFLGFINVYEQLGDPATLFALLHIPMSDSYLHWINGVGFILAAYFRIRSKQHLGTSKITQEELLELKAQLQAQIEKENL